MHEKTIKYALTGGPMPADCQAHLEGCDSCRLELEALKKIEVELGEAAPRFSDGRKWKDGIMETLMEDRQQERHALIRGPSDWFRAAAMGAIAAGFAAAIAVLTVGPAQHQPSSYLYASGSASIVKEARQESSYLLDSDEDYTAASLLTGAETLASNYESGGDEVDVLSDTTNGGSWNG